MVCVFTSEYSVTIIFRTREIEKSVSLIWELIKFVTLKPLKYHKLICIFGLEDRRTLYLRSSEMKEPDLRSATPKNEETVIVNLRVRRMKNRTNLRDESEDQHRPRGATTCHDRSDNLPESICAQNKYSLNRTNVMVSNRSPLGQRFVTSDFEAPLPSCSYWKDVVLSP